MILRLTAKLGKKIGVLPTATLPADPNPFADWTARLLTAERVQYILITNTASLYSMVTYGRGITDDSMLITEIVSYLREFIRDDGHDFIFEKFVAPTTGRVVFSKALNRAVTGSMDELVFEAKMHLIERQMSPYDVSLKLNDTLLSYLKYGCPREAFQSLARKAEVPAGDGVENGKE